jgi:hypothetical protein
MFKFENCSNFKTVQKLKTIQIGKIFKFENINKIVQKFLFLKKYKNIQIVNMFILETCSTFKKSGFEKRSYYKSSSFKNTINRNQQKKKRNR